MSSIDRYLDDSRTARDMLRALALYGVGRWHVLSELFDLREPIYEIVADSLARVGLIKCATLPYKGRAHRAVRLTVSGWLHLLAVDKHV